MRITAVLFFSFLFLFALAVAQSEKYSSGSASAPRPAWSASGIEINDTRGNSPQQNPQVIASSDGNYLVVWEDARAGNTTLYAQKIDQNGTRLWASDGVVLSSSAANQTGAQLITDGNGGAIVVWQDFREGNSDLFAQHIGSHGGLLWDSDGIPICQATAGQFSPKLITDGDGGAIITWHDYRSGIGEDIFAQRLGKTGKVLWQKDGLPICQAKGTQWYPAISSDGSNGAVIVWTDGRTSSSDNNIFAQRVDPSGKLLWAKDGVAICSAAQNQERPTIIAAQENLIVAWEDSRTGNVDLYTQKIDTKGTSLWATDGLPICTAPFAQTNPSLAPDGAGGAMVVWADNRKEENAIFAQRVLSSGNLDWGEEGRSLSDLPTKQENPTIVVNRNGLSWSIVWEDYRNGYPALFAQSLNLAGATLWPAGGIPLAKGTKFQEKPVLLPAGNSGATVFWQDRRFGSYDIVGQNISADGVLTWGPNGSVVCDAQGLVNHQNVSMIESSDGSILLVFEDSRSGFFNIYGQKISPDGTLRWGRDGLPIAKVKANQANPQIVSDGAGGAIVTWEDQRDPASPKIFAQRIASSGKKVWEKGSIAITKVKSKQSRPLLTADGAGGAIIIWQDERNPLSFKDLYVQKVSGSGDLLWGKNGLVLCEENGDQTEAAIIADETGGAIITWADFRRGDRNPDIYVQRVLNNGKLLWTKDGVLVCGAPDIQRTPSLIGDNNGGAIIVWTDKGGGSYDIYAQRVNSEGQTQWVTDGIPISQAGRTQQNPQIGQGGFVVWEDYRLGNWDIFSGFISPNGKVLLSDGGTSVASLPQTQYAPQFINWVDGSIVVAWEDYRSGKQYEIYLQKITAAGKSAWRENGFLVKSRNGARAPKLLALQNQNAFVVVWEDYYGGGHSLYGQKFLVD